MEIDYLCANAKGRPVGIRGNRGVILNSPQTATIMQIAIISSSYN